MNDGKSNNLNILINIISIFIGLVGLITGWYYYNQNNSSSQKYASMRKNDDIKMEQRLYGKIDTAINEVSHQIETTFKILIEKSGDNVDDNKSLLKEQSIKLNKQVSVALKKTLTSREYTNPYDSNGDDRHFSSEPHIEIGIEPNYSKSPHIEIGTEPEYSKRNKKDLP